MGNKVDQPMDVGSDDNCNYIGEISDDDGDDDLVVVSVTAAQPLVRRIPIVLLDDDDKVIQPTPLAPDAIVDLDSETILPIEVSQNTTEETTDIMLSYDSAMLGGHVIELDSGDDDDDESQAKVSNLDATALVIYPPKGSGRITITTDDFHCLGKEKHLNDVIIDFYLTYLSNEVLSNVQRSRSHIFGSFFYKRLRMQTKTVSSRRRHWSGDATRVWLSAGAKERHTNVRNWTKHVNLFEKDFVFVPINERNHWYLAVVCFPALNGPVAMHGGAPIETLPSSEPVHQPCILIFDSMQSVRRDYSKIITNLQEFLTCEYQAKFDKSVPSRQFTSRTMPGHTIAVPQQDNYSDCGLFLLQFVEEFFADPITDYNQPIKELAKWFNGLVVIRKREEIATLIANLVSQHNPSRAGQMPAIKLPTKDGELE